MSPSVWYCPAPTNPNGVGVEPDRETGSPNPSNSSPSVALCPLSVSPRVVPSASACVKWLAPPRRSLRPGVYVAVPSLRTAEAASVPSQM